MPDEPTQHLSSEQRWEAAVEIAWEAGQAVKHLLAGYSIFQIPPAAQLYYLATVFLAAARGQPRPNPWGPPPSP